MSLGPATLSKMPRAPSMADSSIGEVIAAIAAFAARLSPLATPIPISDEPALARMVFTSAKSVLMSPGVVMMPVIPETPCISTSSAFLNASSSVVLSVAIDSSFSLGITISVSTFSFSFAMPASACTERRRPSKENGRVTMPMVSAPSLLAISATIGAAPVPVPPPSPAVMNTMSAPARCS